jgi:hypothetical protein
MPKILAQPKTIECVEESNQQKILPQNSIDLYNDGAKVINYRGVGSCDICAVKVEGKLSAANWRDRTSMSFVSSPLSTTNLR